MANIKSEQKNPLHPAQMQILLNLMRFPNAKFRDLRIEDMPTDHFTYHLNKLVELKFIEKQEGNYFLTEKGKKFVSIIDTENAKHEVFGKRGVLFRITKFDTKEKEHYYLAYKRLKQPFYGYYGFHTGKIRFGESPLATLYRECKEETNLEIIDYEFIGIYHQIGFTPEGELLRDIYQYIFNIYNWTGDMIPENLEDGVKNVWMKDSDFQDVPTYPGFWGDSILNWQNIPTYYKKYKSLKAQGQWENKDLGEDMSITFLEDTKTIEKW